MFFILATMTIDRKNKLLAVLDKRQQNLTVVLENVFDPHNIAAVMRTCDSVGIQDIYTITNLEPRAKRWGFKSGSGAKKWLTIHEFTNVNDCFNELRNTYSTILATHIEAGSTALYDIDFTKSIALVFGNERYGASEEARAMADGSFVIPQCGIIQSLNISVACAVTVYEAYRQKNIAGHYNCPALDMQARSRVLKDWRLNESNQSVVEKAQQHD